jgi:hypothetical protein
VDKLKIIQLGITLSDAKGRMPLPVSTWQFNFDFNIDLDLKDEKSIQMLVNSGIDFSLLKQHGIPAQYFGEKVVQSGLVLNPSLTWICFHGCFDMAYFLKILTCDKLPPQKSSYHQWINTFFPKLLDIKSFVYSQIRFDGGLQRIGEYLGVIREGDMHQAGSDSMFTIQVFFAIFNNLEGEQDRKECKIICDQFNNEIYGYTNEQAHRFQSYDNARESGLQMDAAIFDPQYSQNGFDHNDPIQVSQLTSEFYPHAGMPSMFYPQQQYSHGQQPILFPIL